MRICVTSIGSISGSFVIRRLRQLGHFVIGFNVLDNQSFPIAKECDEFSIVPHSNEDSYINEILLTAKYYKCDAILPLTDTEAIKLSQQRVEFSKIGISILCPSYESLRVAQDKYLMSEVVRGLGLANIFHIPTYDNFENVALRHQYPIVQKPRCGRSSEGFSLISIPGSRPSLDGAEFIYQPFISGVIITVDVLRLPAKSAFYACFRTEIERSARGAGLVVKTLNNKSLQDSLQLVLEKLGVEGVINIELIATGNSYYLMDFNLRLSAGCEFSNLAGYDFLGALLSQENELSKYFNCQIKPMTMKMINGKAVILEGIL